MGRAADYRRMVCQVYGCSMDAVRLDEFGGSWQFQFSENESSDYPLNYDFTMFLREAKMIGQNDRVDSAFLEVDKKDCVGARGMVGDMTCVGKVSYAGMRVRTNEHYLSGNVRGSTYGWRTVTPEGPTPWTFELRTLPGHSESEYRWAISLYAGTVAHHFFPITINQCRSNI